MSQHAYIDGTRFKEAERLSPAMWRILFDIRDHGEPFFSRSDRAAGSLRSLQKQGLVLGENQLTARGLYFCRVEWRTA